MAHTKILKPRTLHTTSLKRQRLAQLLCLASYPSDFSHKMIL